MNRSKDPFGDLFADKRTSQPMKRSAVETSGTSHSKAVSDLLPKTIPVPRTQHVKDEGLYQSMHGLDDLSSVHKPAPAASTFDAFDNFGDIALPEVLPAPQDDVFGSSHGSSEFSTPRTPARAASEACSPTWAELRALATSLVDQDQAQREDSLAGMDAATRTKMLVIMQENWEDYGFAQHTMALCARFELQPTATFELLCAQENSAVNAPSRNSSAASSFSGATHSHHARSESPAPTRTKSAAPAPSFNLLDADLPAGILPPGFTPPPTPSPSRSGVAPTKPAPAPRSAAVAASPLSRVHTASAAGRDEPAPTLRAKPALPPQQPRGEGGSGQHAPVNLLDDYAGPSSSGPPKPFASPRRVSSSSSPELRTPEPASRPATACASPAVDLLGDESLHSSVYDASMHTHARSVGRGLDLLGDDLMDDSGIDTSFHAPTPPPTQATPGMDLLGGTDGGEFASSARLDGGAADFFGADSAADANGEFTASAHARSQPAHVDLLGDPAPAADDSGLDSFFAFVDSAAPSARASAKNSSDGGSGTTHGRSARAGAAPEASGRRGPAAVAAARSRNGEVDEEGAELLAKLAHLSVSARLEDVALALGLGDHDGFDDRIQKARPMWEGMQKDKPGNADPPLRHQLWKARVHKQIAKVLLSLVELEEKEKRIQAEADVGRAARPLIQKEIDSWARENMGIKRLPNLLATLHKGPLWEGAKWTPVNISDVLDDKKLKLIYRKAMLLTHTDKHADSTPEVKERSKLIYEVLIGAKDRMNAEKGTTFL